VDRHGKRAGLLPGMALEKIEVACLPAPRSRALLVDSRGVFLDGADGPGAGLKGAGASASLKGLGGQRAPPAGVPRRDRLGRRQQRAAPVRGRCVNGYSQPGRLRMTRSRGWRRARRRSVGGHAWRRGERVSARALPHYAQRDGFTQLASGNSFGPRRALWMGTEGPV